MINLMSNNNNFSMAPDDCALGPSARHWRGIAHDYMDTIVAKQAEIDALLARISELEEKLSASHTQYAGRYILATSDVVVVNVATA